MLKQLLRCDREVADAAAGGVTNGVGDGGGDPDEGEFGESLRAN